MTTSIKPLQLIAMAITEGVSEPALVLDSTQDPHHPSLRPSQRRAMEAADVFLWTGPVLETGLEKVTPVLPGQVITAINLQGMTLHRIGGMNDPHLWLDTYNAALVGRALAQALSALDSNNALRYQANLAEFERRLGQLEATIAKTLQADTFPPFAVYHNGYQYFEKQFGLDHVASFTSNEEVQPGIRQVLAIRQQLVAASVNCLIVGPSQNTAFLVNQLDLDAMQYVSIDVLAHDVALASDGYEMFMANLASAFASCR